MKTFLLVFTFLIFFYFTGSCQSKNSIYFGLRFFSEIDKPFALKQKNTENTYLFNKGAGLRIKYVHHFNKMFSFGTETGGWYFWNNAKNIDPVYGSFKTRNIIIPMLAVIHFRPFEFNKIYFSIGLKAGLGYVQTINKFDYNQVNVYPNWHSLFEFSLSFYLKRNVKTSFPIRGFGYINEFILGRVIRSIYLDLYRLDL